MLVLTRKSKQSIMIGDDIEVTVLSNDGAKVRLGIQAPQAVPVRQPRSMIRFRPSAKRAPVASSARRGVHMGAERDNSIQPGYVTSGEVEPTRLNANHSARLPGGRMSLDEAE